MATVKYPNTLTATIRDLVENEHFTINDVLESAQFLFSEHKLSQMITHKMRGNILEFLKNNNAPRWK